jgi:histidyl-tRNA synthetase
MKFQAPKGTRDFYPADMALRNWIMDAWRRVSIRNGFEEYDGPIFEYLDLYRAKSGEGIVSELFHFEDRGGRELSIRPEMTPTLARMVAAKAQSLPRPIKWFSMPRLCRAERPQRGRLREFFQWNVDIVGTDDVLADAECIFVMVDFLREVGLTPAEAVMKINSRSLLAALLTARGFGPDRHESIYGVLDKRDKLPPEAFIEALAKITQGAGEIDALQEIGQARGAEGLETLAGTARGNEAAEGEMLRLHGLLEQLACMGVADYCTFDMGVVRGLAYYTGVVFEGFGKGGLQRAICGGGRYGKLLEVVGGPAMSGIGFGTSDVVIQDLLADVKRLPDASTTGKTLDFFVVDAAAELLPAVVAAVARLRQAGLRAEFSYRRQGVGKQLQQASSSRAARAVIFGSEYASRGVLTVKDLATGQQAEVALDAFWADPQGWPKRDPASSAP